MGVVQLQKHTLNVKSPLIQYVMWLVQRGICISANSVNVEMREYLCVVVRCRQFRVDYYSLGIRLELKG